MAISRTISRDYHYLMLLLALYFRFERLFAYCRPSVSIQNKNAVRLKFEPLSVCYKYAVGCIKSQRKSLDRSYPLSLLTKDQFLKIRGNAEISGKTAVINYEYGLIDYVIAVLIDLIRDRCCFYLEVTHHMIFEFLFGEL